MLDHVSAQIELRLLRPQTGLPLAAGWPYLWTVVQWQDLLGNWQDVKGWRGTLDEVVCGEDGRLVGRKVWWVAQADLGKGPFRWQVYQDREGSLFITSEPFYLPGPGAAMQMLYTILRRCPLLFVPIRVILSLPKSTIECNLPT